MVSTAGYAALPISRSVASPFGAVVCTACAPTVTVAPTMGFAGSDPSSTTLTVTARTFSSAMLTGVGVIHPSGNTFTGTVTTLPSFSTVTVPAVGVGTSFMAARPSVPVIAR